MTTPPANIPQRFREVAFRFYEPFIAHVVNNYPTNTVLDPKKLGKSIETLSARVRDAMRSYETYRWSSTLMTYDAFTKAWNSGIVVRQDLENGLVILGAKGHVKEPVVPSVDVAAHNNSVEPRRPEEPFDHAITVETYNEFRHLAALAHNRQLLNPVILRVYRTAWVSEIMASYDVDLEQGGDPGIFTLR